MDASRIFDLSHFRLEFDQAWPLFDLPRYPFKKAKGFIHDLLLENTRSVKALKQSNSLGVMAVVLSVNEVEQSSVIVNIAIKLNNQVVFWDLMPYA